MASRLNLSVNELWALLTRTFEALYGHERDYYDMARTVLWLECHGHHGVRQLIDVLPILEDKTLAEPSLSEQTSGHFVIDGMGHSLFCIGRSICDLAMAFAAESGRAHFDIINVVDAKPLIGVLNYAASQGFSALAFCHQDLAIIQSGAKHPTIYANDKPDGLSLICMQSDDGLNEYASQDLSVLQSKNAQKSVYATILERGIHIKRSDYDALNRVANRVLVEASEASRKGAGE